ncbi:S-acyltransferase [Klebsormidium nitens]|uniref:S-acyltransferase n=1 Tax=Klebsormidium nitens TaxID=105231 RepID=A0A1Y1HTV8_KLENI|nr:S-acyltransferase [Klebsormidium nitens]|eukprot:GAQ82065.1 S-acyltransferase [Klebsormidium nitens]
MAYNVFRFCTGLKVVGSLMILVVLGVVGVSYYAVVAASYGPELLDGGGKAAGALLVILAFHVLLFMLLWSYFAVVFTDPGGVPSGWRPPPQEQDEELGETAPFSGAVPSQGAPDSAAGDPPGGAVGGRRPRYCRKCMAFKPARCHHCSVCQRCILRMDHHCVWVVNCVGAKNYKFFLLFLLYTFLECTLTAAALLPHFIFFFQDEDQQAQSASNLATVFLAFVLNLAFALSVLGFLVMHTSMVLSNTTTIEAFEKKVGSRWRFDVGKRKNFEQVFGLRPLIWLLPLYTEEDFRRIPALNGLDFPVRSDLESQDRW